MPPRASARRSRPWRRLQPGEFDLLLTDLMMPEMDGITLINAARKIDPSLGAIVMTGHGTIDTAVQAMQGGALDYILKPFKLNVILPVIARALDVQRLRRENAELQERERRRSDELAAAYQDLESFSYSISHDLRAPLRSIDSFAQILAEDFAEQLGEEGSRIIGVIRNGSQKMDQLIVGSAGILARRQTGSQSRSHRHDSARGCGGRRDEVAVRGSRTAHRNRRAAGCLGRMRLSCARSGATSSATP